MQHWGLMYAVPPVNVPLVIDLAGPHLLERLYWGNRDWNRDLAEKLAALRRADFIICGGEFQRHYFWPYLAMAGFDLQIESFPVIPFSVSPVPVEGTPAAGSEATFIYGGAFLAWQNPERAITWLLDEMDRAGRGRLLFYGGAHPAMDASGGRFVALYRKLQEHPRVAMRGWLPFADLLAEYAHKGHVALDLMERNPERELAYTTRTMVYLQCGLPVIYNNYSEISHIIKANGCGWSVNPEDEAGFRNIVNDILMNPDATLEMRSHARHTALAQSWDKTIGPLADFCAQPHLRRKALAPEAQTTKPALAEANRAPGRYRRTILAEKGRLAGNAVYVPVWLLSKLLQRYLKN
jgi:hypothetical protein